MRNGINRKTRPKRCHLRRDISSRETHFMSNGGSITLLRDPTVNCAIRRAGPVKLHPQEPLSITKEFHLKFLRESSLKVLLNVIVQTKKNEIIHINCHVERGFARDNHSMKDTRVVFSWTKTYLRRLKDIRE